MNKLFTTILSFLPICIFTQTWVSVGGGLNANVLDYTIYNNEIYVGIGSGDGLVKKWDGVSWDTIGDIFNNGIIVSLEVINNQLYALNTTSSSSVVIKWNGISWDTIGNINGYANKIINYSNDLYVSGNFSSVNTGPANRIAKWDGTSWDSLSSGVNNNIDKLVVYNNELYIIGDFTQAGGIAVNYIAKWNGSAWMNVGNGLPYPTHSPDAEVFNNELYVSDIGITNSGNCSTGIMKWNNTVWDSINSIDTASQTYVLADYYDSLYCQKRLSSSQIINVWENNNWSAFNVDNSLVDTTLIREAFVHNGELYNIGSFQNIDSMWNYTGNYGIMRLDSCNILDTNIDVNGNTLVSQAIGVNYQWVDCDNNNSYITSANNQSFTPSVNGNYAVEISDGLCPVLSDCHSITWLSIENSNHELNINIYPNPSSKTLNIHGINGHYSYAIFDVVGKKYMEKLNTSNTIIRIDNLTIGIYFIRIEQNNKVQTIKMIKQ